MIAPSRERKRAPFSSIRQLAGKGCGGTLYAQKKHAAAVRFAGCYLAAGCTISYTCDRGNVRLRTQIRKVPREVSRTAPQSIRGLGPFCKFLKRFSVLFVLRHPGKFDSGTTNDGSRMKNYVNKIVLRALIAFQRNTRGQDLIEYALMAGFVAVAAGSIMPGVATSISRIFSKIASVMTNASAQGS
jgi:pilus assembly protein Flp/PilA